MMRLFSEKMISFAAVIIFLLAAPLFCFPQKQQKEDSELLSKLQKDKIDTTEIAKAVFLFKSGEIQAGKNQFLKIIEKIRRPGNEDIEAALWHKLALLIPSRDTTGITRLYCLEKMHVLYKQTGNEERQIEALKCIADIHLVQGRLDLAETQLLDVLQRYKAISYPKLYYAYDLLSATYRSKGDFSKAIYYGHKAIESKEQNHDSDADTYYSRLANIYRELNEPAKSVEWYWKLFRESEWRESSNQYKFRDAGFLARELIKLKKEKEALAFVLDIKEKNTPIGKQAEASLVASLAHCYHAIGDETKADKYYLELIERAPGLIPNNEITTDVNYEIGQYLAKKQQYEKAAIYLQKALNAPQGINSASVTKDIYLMLYMSDSAMGNYPGALQNLMKHRLLSDSMFNEIKSRQIEELRVQYETSEKEKDIQLLNKKNQLQLKKVEEVSRTKNITLIGAAIVLIFAGLLVNRYIIKQRSNRKLQAQQKELDQKNHFLEILIADQKKLLEEKEWLIKEVHHRVQNNLQVITSLLNSQSVYLDDPAAVMAVKDSLRRMQAMSLIHQKIYQSENIAFITIPGYIRDLVSYLRNSFDLDDRIIFEQQIEPIKLDVSQAIPLGLIINESIINSIKYAFPNGQNGIVSIIFQKDGDDHLLLKLSDNGIGLVSGADIKGHSSLGIELMQGLTNQLSGKFTIESNHGLHITVRFPALNHV